MRIYISGPYSASTSEGILANVQKAMRIGGQLVLIGHAPYIPHLTHFLDDHLLHQGVILPWEKWIELDLAWLKVSEALFSFGSSPGADIELGHAQLLGLAIFYDLNQVPIMGATQ